MILPAASAKKFDLKLAKSTLNLMANVANLMWIFKTNQQVSNLSNSPLHSFCLMFVAQHVCCLTWGLCETDSNHWRQFMLQKFHIFKVDWAIKMSLLPWGRMPPLVFLELTHWLLLIFIIIKACLVSPFCTMVQNGETSHAFIITKIPMKLLTKTNILTFLGWQSHQLFMINSKNTKISSRGHCFLYLSFMMTSQHGNSFHITGPLSGESTSHLWIKASDVEIKCFLCCTPGHAVEQTVNMLMIWDAMVCMWCDCNAHNTANIHHVCCALGNYSIMIKKMPRLTVKIWQTVFDRVCSIKSVFHEYIQFSISLDLNLA